MYKIYDFWFDKEEFGKEAFQKLRTYIIEIATKNNMKKMQIKSNRLLNFNPSKIPIEPPSSYSIDIYDIPDEFELIINDWESSVSFNPDLGFLSIGFNQDKESVNHFFDLNELCRSICFKYGSYEERAKEHGLFTHLFGMVYGCKNSIPERENIRQWRINLSTTKSFLKTDLRRGREKYWVSLSHFEAWKKAGITLENNKSFEIKEIYNSIFELKVFDIKKFEMIFEKFLIG